MSTGIYVTTLAPVTRILPLCLHRRTATSASRATRLNGVCPLHRVWRQHDVNWLRKQHARRSIEHEAARQAPPVKGLQPRRVHLIVGGRYHDMDFARLELLKLLAEQPHLRATTASDYADCKNLHKAELLITYTCDFAPDARQTECLDKFLRRGGRWIALHGTNAVLAFLANGTIGAAPGHDAFMDMLGTRFLAHPPIGPFQVQADDPDHELTRGIEPFDVIDELYLFETRAKLQVLLHTRFHGDCAPFAAADWQTDHAPVMYLHDHKAGSVLYLSLGHCRGHYDPSPNGAYIDHPVAGAWAYPVYYELLRRSLRWGLERRRSHGSLHDA